MDEELDVDVESAEDVPDIGVEATAGTYDEGFHDSVSYTVCTNRTWYPLSVYKLCLELKLKVIIVIVKVSIYSKLKTATARPL